MLGYGSVVVRGTGGTPEPFVMIAHPQEFRRAVQEQIGAPQAPHRNARQSFCGSLGSGKYVEFTLGTGAIL